MNPTPDMSVWHLIWNASLIVQLVMLTLVVASIASWAVIFQRKAVYDKAQKANEAFENEFWSGGDLSALYQKVAERQNSDAGSESIFKAGFKEFTRLSTNHVEPAAIMQGVTRSIRVALNQEQAKLEETLPFLASVGSVSPYIGLFGTVIGIMTSFMGLANVHQATLAVVAPGIAEALIATAIGLFAAIPAVLAYNRFSAKAESQLSQYETFADEFCSILHREAHGRHSAR